MLKFHDPREVFTPEAYDASLKSGATSAAIYASIGFGHNIAVDENGDPYSGRMVYHVRDTTAGAVLRSRFFLGLDSQTAEGNVPDAIGLGLLQHCYSEFTTLSRFLPSLYYGERAEPAPEQW